MLLSVWSEVQTCIWPSWCHCHSLSLASVKSRLVLPFWYWLTWVVPDKGPLNGCACVHVHVRVRVRARVCVCVVARTLFICVAHRPQSSLDLTVNEPAMWVKIASSWTCIVIYTWTIVAPMVLRSRDFD